jgi:hypothetical protein
MRPTNWDKFSLTWWVLMSYLGYAEAAINEDRVAMGIPSIYD